MSWKFSRKIWLFLIASFSFGLGQAFTMLFLNFYLRALGLDEGVQGLINALPAFVSAFLSIPAILVTRRLNEINTMKLGSILSMGGLAMIGLSNGPVLAISGSILQGVGSALVMVSSAPFMAGETHEENRVPLFSLQMALTTSAGFLGNIIGGRIPELYGRFAGISADSLPAVRSAILIAVFFMLAGTIPMFFIKSTKEVLAKDLKLTGFSVENKVLMFKLVFPGILVGLGAGATIPYLNLFIEAKFNIDYAMMGSLFGWTSLATATTVLIQPWLVRRLGQIKAVVVVQLASLPFLFLLGYSPLFFLVVVAMFTRGALMNAAGPVFTALAMNLLPHRDRPVFSALNMMAWNIGWAIAATVSGIFRKSLGEGQILHAFNWLFAWTILMYALSILVTYLWLYQVKDEKTSV